MMSEQLLVEQIATPDRIVPRSHPTNSSRLLQGLMSLSQRAEAATDRETEGPHSLGGAISRSVLRTLMSALHYRDISTVEHARRTAMLATGVAERLRWERNEIKRLEVAALLHDIGKIGVPDNILFKPGPLSTDESELMALHHHTGIDVLQACHVDSEVLEIIRQAHRCYDGVGEIFRGPGGSIHLGARILAVSDAYDSLSTDQVYRRAKPHKQVMEILTEASGTRFDGNVVATLGRWLEVEGLPYARGGGTDPESLIRPEDALEVSQLCHIFSYLYVLESLYDGFYLVDSDLRFIVWNQSAENLLGRPASDVRGQTWTSRLLGLSDRNDKTLPDDRCPMKRVIADGRPTTSVVKLQHAEGHSVEVEVQSMPLLDGHGRLQGVAEILRDLNRTSRRPREFRELKLAATRDSLTMLANRGELETQLTSLFSEYAKSHSDPFSVIFADLDFFKSINDSHGHSIGDRVLVDTARLFQKETYSGELVCRYGGEEFVILCPGTKLEDAQRRAERLRVVLSRSSVADLKDFKVTCSFGVAEIEPGDSVENLLRRADKALYMAKQKGRNRTCTLTTADIESGLVEEPIEDEHPDPWVFKATLRACVAADMIVYKLGGFVSDNRAKLVSVAPAKAVLHVGSAGLLPFWGGSDDRQPVEVTVSFDDHEGPTAAGRRVASSTVKMEVVVRPRGWIRKADVFGARARHVVKELRSYFVAD
jgi:diguanylate cyclase (GGDEF)-like protein/PAS domain S-box-containing protein/putative nucleotidyltransferase with HDIG domain